MRHLSRRVANPQGGSLDRAARIERIVERYGARKEGGSIALAISQPSRDFEWRGGVGPRSPIDTQRMTSDSPYFIASATKLHTTALVMQLRAEGRLTLDDPVSKHLPPDKLRGIHVFEGADHGNAMTIRHLLAHTSGLADYFEQAQVHATSIMGELASGRDRSWTLEDVLELNRTKLKPKFAPGTPGKAFYSDTNYQLLGAVVEGITGDRFA